MARRYNARMRRVIISAASALAICWHYALQRQKVEMAYRSDFLINVGINILYSVVQIFFIWALFYRVPDIAGWSFEQVVLIYGFGQLTFGYFLGVMAAWRVGSRFDSAIQTFSILVFSSPIFWVAMVFLYVFGFQLSWFPLGGNYTAGADYPSTFAFILDVLKHKID